MCRVASLRGHCANVSLSGILKYIGCWVLASPDTSPPSQTENVSGNGIVLIEIGFIRFGQIWTRSANQVGQTKPSKIILH